MSKIKIVYVDDEECLCRLFPLFIQSPEIEVFTFERPLDALRECRNNPPDILFTDHSMAGLTGENLAKALNLDIPIYLVSGGDYCREDFKYPFADVLSKPFDFKKIKNIIEEFVVSSELKVA